ncbi:MAG TPA: adenylate/guanylate cyclase domain-containing protein, partial [Vineibacter sp.]|nr:adenylate/guanylate cyclase domain-containing protein [Vineibacter sp.]
SIRVAASRVGALRERLDRVRVRIVAALGVGFLAIALVAAAAFAVTVLGASDSTQRLLLDRNRRIVDAQAQFLRDRLDPAAARLGFVATLAARGRLDVGAPAQIVDALAIAVEQVRQVSTAGFLSLDQTAHLVQRTQDGQLQRSSAPLTSIPGAFDRFRELQGATDAFWGELVWSSRQAQPLINVRVPIRRADGSFLGGLFASVGMGELSRLVAGYESDRGDRMFILVGRDRVLAHRALINPGQLGLSQDRPLPALGEVGDPVLAAIWQPPLRGALLERALGSLGHVIEIDGKRWVFIYLAVHGYGPEPWLVGHYFPFEEAARDVERLVEGVWAGAAALVMALLLAALIGVRMARAIGGLGEAAQALERFDFDSAPARRSRLREIDDAAEALEKARAALRWFGLYVPRRLVRRLMEEGEESLLSRRRTVTVMFTDIVGFTPQAEDMDERSIADLLNHHFALLGAAIEQEQGIIDKYIGDSVMAVWGGIRKMPDHADAACRAALAIARVMRDENATLRGRGEPAIRLRIGLHSGPVVIGNIGAPERMNYTVVGDTVNVAQRLEQLGKDHLLDDQDMVVLISGDTLDAIQDKTVLADAPQFVGEQQVRGRAEPEKVYRLV